MLVVNWRCTKNPLAGGAEVYFQEIFSRIVARGHHVTLLCERFPGSEPDEIIAGIRTIRAGGKFTFNFTAARQVGRLADSLNADIVIDDLNKVPFYSPWHTKRPVLAILMHLFRGSIFKEALPPLATYVWLTETMIPWAYKRCRFAVLSESSKKDVVRLGIPAERIGVIPPGTDLEFFKPASGIADCRLAIDDLSGGPGEGHAIADCQSPIVNCQSPIPLILHVGRLKRYKATDHLLHAARLLKDKGRKFRVVIVGAGDDLRRLISLSAKLDIDDVTIFTGFVPEEEKLNWYRRASVLSENSVKEGWGLIVLEANACGTPVVVARSPGLVDSSRDGVNGLMYDYGDVPALAEKLERLLTDEALRSRLGQQAIEWAKQWTWDGAADAMERAIEETVNDEQGQG
jgi:glycosyltransferase involved in cell wall biosynthesis